MADATCAQDVVPAADDEIWEDVTLRFTPGAPQAWPGGLQRAGVSSSLQPDDGGFPGNWCIELKRPKVPWETVDRTAAKFDDWRKFFRVGAQVQNLLRQASELHSNQAVPLFRVCLLITSFLAFFLLLLVSCLSLSTLPILASAARRCRGKAHLHCRPAHRDGGAVPGE